MLRSEKGITLVALVVTIVVLIILATISISVAVNGGLIGKTQDAKAFYENVDERFNQQEQNLVDYIDAYLSNATANAT